MEKTEKEIEETEIDLAMRLMVLEIEEQRLFLILQGKITFDISLLPEDTKYVNSTFDPMRRVFSILLKSKEFPISFVGARPRGFFYHEEILNPGCTAERIKISIQRDGW